MANKDNGEAKCHSCGTFVVLPPASANKGVIFGKNSERPESEVQEVIYMPAADYEPGSSLTCSYIEIPQVSHTHAVILSKPAWMWGAEMGANEHGVCIGREAVYTKLSGQEDLEKKLLGMDLVRLGLERGLCAHHALDVMTQLLCDYGQGGPCMECGTVAYHNSYIIADSQEAWVLETADYHWAAQCIKSGVRHISNELSIHTKIDAMSENCKEFAQSRGWWNPDDGDFDFAKAYSESALAEKNHICERYSVLEKKSSAGVFGVKDMMCVLREAEGNNTRISGFISTGSQVSVLSPADSPIPSCHWFTATPNPVQSTYKPFVFCSDAGIGEDTTSPSYGDLDPAQQDPPFQSKVDRDHTLWKAHSKLRGWLESGDPRGEMLIVQLRELESHCCEDMQEAVASGDERSMAKVAQIFQHMVSLEINFYK